MKRFGQIGMSVVCALLCSATSLASSDMELLKQIVAVQQAEISALKSQIEQKVRWKMKTLRRDVPIGADRLELAELGFKNLLQGKTYRLHGAVTFANVEGDRAVGVMLDVLAGGKSYQLLTEPRHQGAPRKEDHPFGYVVVPVNLVFVADAHEVVKIRAQTITVEGRGSRVVSTKNGLGDVSTFMTIEELSHAVEAEF